MDYYDDYVLEEDKMGMTVTSGSVTLKKDAQNLVGISIGGGAPLCPCLYVVQVFDNTPAAKDGTLQAGDEVVAINGQNVKGKTKVEVAKLIQSFKGEVTVFYNKLHADPKQGKSLDIVLKKVKHRVVEHLSSNAADALGLSRAILCNDSMVKRLNELEATAGMYNGLVARVKKLLQCYYALSQTHKAFGDAFAEIGVKELQPRAAEAFTKFGNVHRAMERCALDFMRKARPIVSDLNTFLLKAVPDTKLTIEKYLDAKFEYLSYCLKVKEMDDEEYAFAALQEPLYRVETGNYEYRLILRCREMARKKFAKLRSDVLVKLELLDQKHVQDIVFQLQRFITHLAQYAQDCYGCMKEAHGLFPIEIDITRQTFTLDRAAAATGISSSSASQSYQDEPEEEEEDGENDDEDVLALENSATPSSGQLPKTGAGADLLQLESGAADAGELLGDFGYPGAAPSTSNIAQSVAPTPSASATSQLLDFGSPTGPAKGELDWQFDELAKR